MVPRAFKSGQPTKYTLEQRNAVLMLRRQNYSWRQIEDATGVNRRTARDVYKSEEKKTK